MPPKKKEGKAATGEEVEGEDPLVLLANYQKFCKSVGLPINAGVVKQLTDEEKYPIEQIIVDEEYGQLGPGGTRALMLAIMGNGPGFKGGPYKLLKSMRLWRANVTDEGVLAVAEILRLGGADVKLSYLEIIDGKIGPRGGIALGQALSHGHNLSLLTLKLDHNGTFGSEGVANLCRGLRTNITLKQLHLQFCGLLSDAGASLADVLANHHTALEVLNVAGNRLAGTGLSALCRGLIVNSKLTTLCLSDNMIDSTKEDLDGLADFRDCLMVPSNALTTVDLLYNRIGETGATVLVPALGPDNTRIVEFQVDLTLPLPLFEQIFRRSGGGGKKGKKGGKKKK